MSNPVKNGTTIEAKNTCPASAAIKASPSSWFELKQGNFIENDNSILKKELSTDILWVKIASIEYVGEEQVYDIEVEGTHNFVANGIIAHNTYISGNVGIGTTNPTSKLHVAGECVAEDSIVPVCSSLTSKKCIIHTPSEVS